MNNWMTTLADHYDRIRGHYPDDELMVFFDIDGTILDMRYMILYLLRKYDQEHDSAFFEGLELGDIDLHENQVDRQRVTWRFDPDITLASGTSKTLSFSATASLTRGDYWSDLMVDFGGGSFSEDRYTWPTALISVKDVYAVTATDDVDNNQVISLEVWISDESGVIDTWNLQ